MDGYAFHQEELQGFNDPVINRISTSFAGNDYSFYRFNSETLCGLFSSNARFIA
jgi:hypothetical protein